MRNTMIPSLRFKLSQERSTLRGQLEMCVTWFAFLVRLIQNFI